ncbi:MAG: hypothetical protein N3A54_02080 [Patescibacteria group bacterium]|nr:hypothetical protein [Patescibacteria group bacterium]
MKTKNANHIHFSPDIRPDGITSNPLFGYYEKGAPYRVIVEGFWRKIHLKKILIPGEDPWNFEIMGSYRSKYFDGYYTYMQSLFDFIRVVEKGRISRKAYRFCLNHNVALNFKKRSLFSIRDQVISSSQSFLFSFIKRIPWKTRLLIMNTLRKILISY